MTMRKRYFAIFWGAASASVLFLGAAWATMNRVFSANGSLLDGAVLVIAGLGLLGSSFVAGRIVLVASRVQRKRQGRATAD